MNVHELFEHFFSSGVEENQEQPDSRMALAILLQPDSRMALAVLLGWVLKQQEKINERLDKIMATLDDVLKDVTDESTLIDSISTLLAGLKQQIADALAGTTLPPAVQAKVDAVFTGAEANKAKLATALASGTPAAAVTPGATP